MFLTIDARFRWEQKNERFCDNLYQIGPLSDLETAKSSCIKDSDCKAIVFRGTAKRVGNCTGLCDPEVTGNCTLPDNCVDGEFVVPGTCDPTQILGFCRKQDLKDFQTNCIFEKGIPLECIFVFNSENGYNSRIFKSV